MKIGEYLGMTVVVLKDRECLNKTTKLTGEPFRYRKLDWWKCYFVDEGRTYNLWHKQVKILHEIPDEVVNALADSV